MKHRAVAEVSPSLALIKYWGKKNRKKNIPATSSLAFSLNVLKTITEVEVSERIDTVNLNGENQGPARYQIFFDNIRKQTQAGHHFCCTTSNNFPTGAGLASSASGFAALAIACCALAGREFPAAKLSAMARVGSASAARAVFGGVTVLKRGALHAEALEVFGIWKELRIIAVCTDAGPKAVSSREAMERSRLTSPYYRSWLADSEKLFREALRAWYREDLEALGELARESYLRMFATMFSARPPLIYWLPQSLEVIRLCAELRARGLPVWETMDAGPQVKILTDSAHAGDVRAAIGQLSGISALFEDKIGNGPVLRVE
ncbi:MAG: diphosphomevalonate decarboxylase [Spirochaetales bacterium]|nr:diphosphomevalonate decarboxylase [Spirochaetales bacterium]